jgi:hypothetical protein
MAKDHEAYQPMPLEVTGEEFFTWPDRPDALKYTCVKGRFTRNPDVAFEIWCVDRPNQSTYKDTRIAQMHIMVYGVTVWSWSAPMEDDGDPYHRYDDALVADILADIEVIYTHFDMPFAVAWRDLAGQSHSKRFETENALWAFLAKKPEDWKELLHITVCKDDQTSH